MEEQKKYILPGLLSENDCLILGKEWTQRLLSCTTATVLYNMEKYLGSDNWDATVHSWVNETYKRKLQSMGLVDTDSQTASDIQLVEGLKLDMQFIYYSEDELRKLDSTIDNVLTLSSEAVAYNTPINSKVVKAILADISENGNNDQALVADEISDSPLKSIFYDKPNAKAHKTAFKKVILNKFNIGIISDGIKFLIEQIESGGKPAQWRHL